MGEGATRPMHSPKRSDAGQTFSLGRLGTPPGSTACFPLVRWHFRSEEPPQRTFREEDTPGNKLGRMQLYLFLLLHKASPLSCFGHF